jgi:hypothetical protein
MQVIKQNNLKYYSYPNDFLKSDMFIQEKINMLQGVECPYEAEKNYPEMLFRNNFNPRFVENDEDANIIQSEQDLLPSFISKRGTKLFCYNDIFGNDAYKGKDDEQLVQELINQKFQNLQKSRGSSTDDGGIDCPVDTPSKQRKSRFHTLYSSSSPKKNITKTPKKIKVVQLQSKITKNSVNSIHQESNEF